MNKFESAVMIRTENYSPSQVQDFFNACVRLGAIPDEAVDVDFLPADYKYIGVDKDDYDVCRYNPRNFNFAGICDNGRTWFADDYLGAKYFNTFEEALVYLAKRVTNPTKQTSSKIEYAKELLGEGGISEETTNVYPELEQGDLNKLLESLDSENVNLLISGGKMELTVVSDTKFYITNRVVLLKVIQYLEAKKSLEESIKNPQQL